MKEYFNTDDYPLHFIFGRWTVNYGITLAFTCLAVIIISILFEGLRVFRVWIRRRLRVTPLFSVLPENLGDTSDGSDKLPVNADYIISQKIKNHIWQTFLHVTRVSSGYLLMLAFMTYNVYICISILAGATLGYFLFCHQLSVWRREAIACQPNLSPATSLTSAGSPEESRPMIATTSQNVLEYS